MEQVLELFRTMGFMNMDWRQLVMLFVSFFLLYLAIKKQYEPLLLLPIAFGMLLTNLPNANMFNQELWDLFLAKDLFYDPNLVNPDSITDVLDAFRNGILVDAAHSNSDMMAIANPSYHSYGAVMKNAGLLDVLYIGVKAGLYPCLIFIGVGAMTDFGPLIANPKSLMLGAAAQIGILITFLCANAIGFTPAEAGSIGIIGGADGPTSIYLTSKLAPHLLGPIAIAA